MLTGFEQNHKVWQVQMQKPETLVLGNSRTLYGFDVSSLEGSKPFNYSYPGPIIEEVEKQFKNMQYLTQAKTVYLVADDICSSGQSSRELSTMFSHDIEWLKAEFLRAKYLISVDTLKASLDSLSKPEFYDYYGRRISFIFGKGSGETLSERVKIREGYALSRERNSRECNTEVFERLLSNAYDTDIDISLILNPTHARLININANNSTPVNSHLKMKRAIVSINAAVAANLNTKPFPIYDFNLINQYTTEPFDLVSNTEPKYWWESSHYKKALGDRLVDWLNTPENGRDASIGVSLTPQNIDQHIGLQLRQLADWQQLNPAAAKESMQPIIN
ncbi:hypothetical protein [Paraglaciecola polaris]|uniref:Uncharacterized protein n=1 Tax=Paraglaciecola polaris LMG 21857 TaxID=1129793 RepID=K6ZLQ3_9ALTE|nr:hypothetical protein [Paraglaciecola polaris]GAC31267.1 hypothetical protein GPLA_0348 [Paraglaciecola polaris LMG 21857]